MDQPIEEVLEECRQRLARGESIDGCLAAYPAHAAELARLLPIATRAQALARDPDPAAAHLARRRFRDRVSAARKSKQSSPRTELVGWLRRLAVPLALVLILLTSGVGLVQASDGSLPDSPLYTVKQAQESVLQIFARGPGGRAAVEMRFANQRLREIEAAQRANKPPALQRTLALRMVEATVLAAQQIGQASPAERARLLTFYRPLVANEQRVLDQLQHSRNREVATTARRLQDRLQSLAQP